MPAPLLSADAWEQLNRVAGYAEMYDGQYANIVYVVEASAAEWATVDAILRPLLQVDEERVERDARKFREELRRGGTALPDEQRRRAQDEVQLFTQALTTALALTKMPRHALATWERVLELIEAEEDKDANR